MKHSHIKMSETIRPMSYILLSTYIIPNVSNNIQTQFLCQKSVTSSYWQTVISVIIGQKVIPVSLTSSKSYPAMHMVLDLFAQVWRQLSLRGGLKKKNLNSLITPEVSQEICCVGIWMNQTLLKHVPVFRSQNWWCFRSIQLRRKTKQVKASPATAQALPNIFTSCLFLTPHTAMLWHIQPRVKRKTARRTRFVNTPARESPTAHVLQASTATSVKVFHTPPRLTLTAGSWAGREQTGVFKEELCYPTGIWSSALEEAAVMMDYCNYQNWHGLAQFTTGTSRLMLWIIVL